MTIQEALVSAIRSGWIPAPEQDLAARLRQSDPDIQQCLVTLAERVEKLSEVGVALSAERNPDKLLRLILTEARHLTGADGGTLYLLDDDQQNLRFQIVQNGSLAIDMGGAGDKQITWEPLPLTLEDGLSNHQNVSTHSVLTGKVINIPDVYSVDGFDFSGTKQFDKSTGYRSRSMLVLPLANHEEEVIGVLQLINAFDQETGKVIAFSKESERLATALASQAAIALTNTMLIRDLKELFDSLIRVIATAVDEKSPYTGGHIARVADLTMRIAEEINRDQDSEFANISFSEEEMEELRIAAWLHDVGKITTPEYVMDKSTKLETIYDRIHTVALRYEILKRDQIIAELRARLAQNEATESGDIQEHQPEISSEELQAELDLLVEVNRGGEFISDNHLRKIESIAQKTYEMGGQLHPILEPDEIKNLQTGRGTLNPTERGIINNHVVMTRNMLNKLPFPRRLQKVPEYAGSHHELLDGSGYPRGLQGDMIPLQTRIMTLADIFEALTAEDRPYKPGKKLSEAIRLLGRMVEEGQVDDRLFRLFIRSGLLEEYAKQHIKPAQIDCTEYDDTGHPLAASGSPT